MSNWRGAAREIRHLAGGKHQMPPRFALHGEMYRQAHLIVRVFYVVTAYFLYDGSRAFSDVVDSPESLDLLWPVEWMPAVGLDLAGKIVAHLGLAAALLGLVWWPFLVVRIAVSAALLLYAAYANSYGAINHGHHEWFWISVCFWLLPTGRHEDIAATRVERMKFLTAFSLAPLLILFFYTMSGFYKCGYALVALLEGRVGGFSPDAMAITLAHRAFQTGSEPMWADLAINHPLVSWPFYLALYFVELVSIVVFFRPQLHRAWGIALILFHMGTLLFMDIVFGKHVIVNGLLFVMSPFALGRHSVHQQFESVPLLGAFYSVIRNPRLVRPRVKAKPPQSSGVVDPVHAPSFKVRSATEHIQA